MATINSIQIRYANTREDAVQAMEQGYCPIECSFGAISVVDELQMDHHGSFSHLECVSVRAYRDHFGVRSSDPRFVVAGNPGADDVFAILALAGLLPHPSREVAPHLAKQLQQDLSDLAVFIAKLDRDPVGVNKSANSWGPMLILWGAMNEGENGIVRHYSAIHGMWRLLEKWQPVALLAAAKHEDEARREKAEAAPFEMVGHGVKLLSECPVPAPDVYHERRDDETNPDTAIGWKAPVVVMFVPKLEKVTIGVANAAVAQDLFGEGGLRAIYADLGEGWGGADTVGGSPRGMKMTADDARETAIAIADIIANMD